MNYTLVESIVIDVVKRFLYEFNDEKTRNIISGIVQEEIDMLWPELKTQVKCNMDLEDTGNLIFEFLDNDGETIYTIKTNHINSL